MAELSTSVTSWLLEWLEGHSISGADWVADICEPEDLIEPDGFIAWESFSRLCDRLAEFSEEPPDDTPLLPAPVGIGREIAEEIFSSAATRFSAGDVPIEILFVDEAPSIANELFPELEVRADIASDGEVILLEVGLPADAIDCPVFFEMIQGVLEAAPLLLDQEPADVAAEIHPERARYAVRIARNFGDVIPLESRIEATQEAAQTELPEEEPHELGMKQAVEVAFDHSTFIRSLAACVNADEVGEHLSALLRERYRCAAFRVRFQSGTEPAAGGRDEETPARLEFGKSDKPPSRSLPFGVGGESLGQIDLWDADALRDDELEELENLIPWYALAFKALAERETSATTQAVSQTANPVHADPTRTRSALASLESIVAGREIEGEHFLTTLVRHLAEHIGAHTAVISLRQPARPMKLRTVVAWKDGAIGDNFSYDARGTPCANVLAGELGCHPRDVQQQFQSDSSLVETQTQSYLGLGLFDPEGRVVGIVSGWSHQPLEQPEEAISLLRIVARGAEIELQNRSDREAREIREVRYRGLAEISHDLIVELSPSSGLLEISPNLSAILGYTPEAFANTSYRELIHPDDLTPLAKRYREAQNDQSTVCANIRIRHRDGSWCLLEARARSYRTRDGEVRVVVAARDLTERAGIEQERQQLVSIIQNSSDLIALTTLSGNLLFLNTSGQRILGLASGSSGWPAKRRRVPSPYTTSFSATPRDR